MAERPAKRGRRGRGPSYMMVDFNEPEETPTSLAGDSLVLAVFKHATKQLNTRQDRHERLVRLSRDLIIESKRIIFLLHSPVKKEDQERALAVAKKRIDKVIDGPLKNIGLELEESSMYLHHRAVTAALQEYIEARTLYSIMSSGKILPYADAQKELKYVVTVRDEPRTVVTLLPHTDYMLGIADLTGELMRKAINSVSSGDKDDVFQACQIVKDLYVGFIGLADNRLLSSKLKTMRKNVNKVEMAMYALNLRDEPALQHQLADEDDGGDDGFY